MSPIIPFPAALNHQSPNLRPHAGWTPSPLVMPKCHAEAPGIEGLYVLYDDEGDYAHTVFVDAIPGLDVYEIH